MSWRYFLESNFVGVNRLFVLVCSNEDADFKRFKAKSNYLPKGIIKNYNVIINQKYFYDQAIDTGVKRHEEIRKLIENRTWGKLYCWMFVRQWLYKKNHYRLIAVDLSRQKEFIKLKNL